MVGRTRQRERTPRRARREQERLAHMEAYTLPLEEHEARFNRRINLIKWGLGLTGLGMLLFTSITAFILILTPIWFRSLPTSEQVVWANRVPLLEAFRPTRVYAADALPTAMPREGGSPALFEPVASPTPLTSPTPPPTATAMPFLPGPTSVLATTTPVLAPLLASPTAPPALAAQPTPTATPTIPPPPPPTAIPVPSSHMAVGYRFEKQQWNTCGPANLKQALHYFGWKGTQQEITNYVKPNREDRNVSPWEMVQYINEHLNRERGVPLKALMRIGGDLNLVKRLVSNDFAVILEKGYVVAGEGWMGHYLTIQGYDDLRGEMNGLDTYLGERWEKYEQLDERWQQFNRLYIVVYPEARERELAILLGPHRDEMYSIQYALSKAREEASLKPDNPYAWFNVGSAYVMLREYGKATEYFDRARSVGGGLPFRFLWYQFTPYEAYYYTGNYAEVLALAQATLGTSNDLEESHYWRGMALAAQGNFEAAGRSFERALMVNPKFRLAEEKLAQVRNGTFQPPRIG